MCGECGSTSLHSFKLLDIVSVISIMLARSSIKLSGLSPLRWLG